MNNIKLFAVIVTYNSDPEKLANVINSLIYQVEKIVIVKNSNEILNLSNCDIIQLPTNKGIAFAQNFGIQRAFELGANWILLSDQDTIFPKTYIDSMYKKIQNFGSNVIYVPSFYNEVKKQKEPVSLSIKNSIIPDGNTPISLFQAISSGTIFHESVFSEIGYFNELLFIDYVDFEWCWRAKRKNIDILCFPDLIINHNLGDSYKNFFSKKITLRTDFRYYYMLRNGYFLSMHSKYLRIIDKLYLFCRTFVFSLGILLLRPNIKSMRIINKAFFRGIFKKLIEYDL